MTSRHIWKDSAGRCYFVLHSSAFVGSLSLCSNF